MFFRCPGGSLHSRLVPNSQSTIKPGVPENDGQSALVNKCSPHRCTTNSLETVIRGAGRNRLSHSRDSLILFGKTCHRYARRGGGEQLSRSWPGAGVAFGGDCLKLRHHFSERRSTPKYL
jgi:hypothetical protein